MNLVQGYRFFTPAECARVRACCDRKGRQVRKLVDAPGQSARPPGATREKRDTVGITRHGYPALDREPIAGSAIDGEFQETIFLRR